jgi:hypothetical protein
MIIETITTDGKGRTYDKIFSNFLSDINVHLKNENKPFSTMPNFAIRMGNSKFGDQVVLQWIIKKELQNYNAKHENDGSYADMVEAYFPINAETLELFEKTTARIKRELVKSLQEKS